MGGESSESDPPINPPLFHDVHTPCTSRAFFLWCAGYASPVTNGITTPHIASPAPQPSTSPHRHPPPVPLRHPLQVPRSRSTSIHHLYVKTDTSCGLYLTTLMSILITIVYWITITCKAGETGNTGKSQYY